ncbi:MAG: phosphoglyceromutase, partial [Spirochaetes bacterium]
MKKLFLFFIDGIGLGDDIHDNPVRTLFASVTGNTSLVRTGAPLIFEGGVVVPADACLGVEGIPQSATGQATIFTGVNASKFLGYHLTAIPNE